MKCKQTAEMIPKTFWYHLSCLFTFQNVLVLIICLFTFENVLLLVSAVCLHLKTFCYWLKVFSYNYQLISPSNLKTFWYHFHCLFTFQNVLISGHLLVYIPKHFVIDLCCLFTFIKANKQLTITTKTFFFCNLQKS